jgi:hypothetical protein
VKVFKTKTVGWYESGRAKKEIVSTNRRITWRSFGDRVELVIDDKRTGVKSGSLIGLNVKMQKILEESDGKITMPDGGTIDLNAVLNRKSGQKKTRKPSTKIADGRLTPAGVRERLTDAATLARKAAKVRPNSMVAFQIRENPQISMRAPTTYEEARRMSYPDGDSLVDSWSTRDFGSEAREGMVVHVDVYTGNDSESEMKDTVVLWLGTADEPARVIDTGMVGYPDTPPNKWGTTLPLADWLK